MPHAYAAMLMFLLLSAGTAEGASVSSSSGLDDGTAPAATGIDAAGNWSYTMAFDAAEGGPVLTAGSLRVVYSGEAYNGRSSGSVTFHDGQMGSSQSGSLHVDTQGTSGTITFRGKSFKLQNSAKSLLVGQEAYKLADDTTTTVHFAADGTSTVSQKQGAAGK